MSTAEELRAQIAATHQTLQAEIDRTEQLRVETAQANERQHLRRQLESLRDDLEQRRLLNRREQFLRQRTDEDKFGPELPSQNPIEPVKLLKNSGWMDKGGITICNDRVRTGEFYWTIKGLSWLVTALRRDDDEFAYSPNFRVYDEFQLVYNPLWGRIGYGDEAGNEHFGSLAIVQTTDPDDELGSTFRFTFFIQRADGAFVQWGEQGDVCLPNQKSYGWAFGPDVQGPGSTSSAAQRGIFGLSYQELLQSEWVKNDSLSVKVKLEVREEDSIAVDFFKQHRTIIEVPPGNLTSTFLQMLEEGKNSDVTFVVQGEPMKAHSLIVCARSEVFDRQLNGSMQESVSKEVAIDDCSATTFRALLRFLYTDDFKHVEDLVDLSPGKAGAGQSSGGTPLLQELLSTSHKYQIPRLRAWCEQRLCEQLCSAEVASVLCQAHLYEARQLEEACLTFIKENLSSVVVTPAFGTMSTTWPEVLLKVNVFIAGVTESTAGPALAAQREALRGGGGSSKRKRDE